MHECDLCGQAGRGRRTPARPGVRGGEDRGGEGRGHSEGAGHFSEKRKGKRMRLEIRCSTQAEVDAALAAGDFPLLSATARIEVSADCRLICDSGQPHTVDRSTSTA